MSASEKLEALAASYGASDFKSKRGQYLASSLVDVLPQIRALVEAAERVAVVPEGANPRHQITLREVLADLDKALGEQA